MLRAALLLMVLAGIGPLPLAAQRVEELPRGSLAPEVGRTRIPDSALTPDWAGPLALGLTLLVPGTGHHLSGESGGAPWLAVDLLGWAVFLERRRQGEELEERFRELAWRFARDRSFPRVDGGWGYFERLARWEASGRFDADPSRPGIQPETDPSTHNGAIWALARSLYLRSGGSEGEDGGAWARALAYYEARGIRPEFAWDWRGNVQARSVYEELVAGSDDQFRRSVTWAGVLLANRVLATAHLFVRQRSGEPPPLELSLLPPFDPPAPGSGVWVHIRLPLR
jgi:hypothetical protein